MWLNIVNCIHCKLKCKHLTKKKKKNYQAKSKISDKLIIILQFAQ